MVRIVAPPSGERTFPPRISHRMLGGPIRLCQRATNGSLVSCPTEDSLDTPVVCAVGGSDGRATAEGPALPSTGPSCPYALPERRLRLGVLALRRPHGYWEKRNWMRWRLQVRQCRALLGH